MARPRAFDEQAVCEAAMQCFWGRGYEATSIKDLAEHTGIAVASLYNTFGDKRGLFRRAFDDYVENGIGERIRRLRRLPPRQAIEAFFHEVVSRSLADDERKGCMLVNSALELAPHDIEFHERIASALDRIEAFFLGCLRRGQRDGSIGRAIPARTFARHLMAVLMGVRVLARARPGRAMLEGAIHPALAWLDPQGLPGHATSGRPHKRV